MNLTTIKSGSKTNQPDKTDMKIIKTLALVAISSLLLVNGNAQSFLTNGLVAYYPFNGNANDASGNGNNGQLIGGCGYSSHSWSSLSSLWLNGKSGYAQAPMPNSPTNNITICAWVNYTNLTGYGGLGVVTKGIDQEYSVDWHLGLNQDIPCRLRPHILAGGNWVYFDCNSIIYSNTWYHIAMIYDGSKIQGYVNGKIDGSTAASGPINLTQSNLRIGAYAPVNGSSSKSFFPGYIVNVRIYNRALSTNEMTQLFQIESAPILNAFNAIGVATANLKVGTNYQFQVSSNLVNWINSGSVFTATNSSWTNYYPATSSSQFYRLLQQ